MNFKYNILLMVLILAITACDNMIDADSNIDKRLLTEEISENYFPNKVRNYWIYENTHIGYADKLVVKIDGEVVLQSNLVAKIWNYDFKIDPSRNFSIYVWEQDNYIWMQYPDYPDKPIKLIPLPLRENSEWHSGHLYSWWDPDEGAKFRYDANYCQGITNVITDFYSFSDCYEIRSYNWSSLGYTNEFSNEKKYFKPEIGITKIIFYDTVENDIYGLNKEEANYELVDYYLQ